MLQFKVQLKKGQSFTVRGPFTNKMYKFIKGEEMMVHPKDFDYFKCLPDRFQCYEPGPQGSTTLRPRRTRPLSHSSIGQVMAVRGSSKPKMTSLKEHSDKVIQQAAQHQANMRNHRKAQAEKVASIPVRPPDDAIKASSPDEALAIMEKKAAEEEVLKKEAREVLEKVRKPRSKKKVSDITKETIKKTPKKRGRRKKVEDEPPTSE